MDGFQRRTVGFPTVCIYPQSWWCGWWTSPPWQERSVSRWVSLRQSQGNATRCSIGRFCSFPCSFSSSFYFALVVAAATDVAEWGVSFVPSREYLWILLERKMGTLWHVKLLRLYNIIYEMILFRISDCLTLLFVFFVWLQWMINFRIHMKILFTTNMKRWQKVGGAVEAHRKECFKRHRNIIETFRCVVFTLTSNNN